MKELVQAMGDQMGSESIGALSAQILATPGWQGRGAQQAAACWLNAGPCSVLWASEAPTEKPQSVTLGKRVSRLHQPQQPAMRGWGVGQYT